VAALKFVVVNADDFGISRGVNRGIVEAHEGGIVTSVSLMVDRPAAAEAADYARGRPELGIGLHVELDRWRVAKLPRRGASFSAEPVKRHASEALQRQLERFGSLVGRSPSHLDSHQHRHTQPLVRPVFEHVAHELGVPLRRVDPRVRFCGDFYGHDARGRPEPEAITPEALVQVLERIEEGVTELCCHPGYADRLDEWYEAEREQEVRTLCDARVREAVRRLGLSLRTFSDLSAELERLAGQSIR
jgi:chitin disaccharide deacetylase